MLKAYSEILASLLLQAFLVHFTLTAGKSVKVK